MKKFVALSCMLGLCVVVASGCTTRASQYSAPLRVSVTADLKADVEVGRKVTGSASKTYLFGLIPLSFYYDRATGVDFYYDGNRDLIYTEDGRAFDLYSELKAAAAYDAIKSSGADILVAPRYEVEDNYYILFSRNVATVTGYKGVIKGFKNKESDITVTNTNKQ